MMKKALYSFFTLVLICVFAVKGYGQITTVKAGNWDDPTVWSMGASPNASLGAIIINHDVTIPAAYTATVDEVTLNAALVVAQGGSIVLANGLGSDLTI